MDGDFPAKTLNAAVSSAVTVGQFQVSFRGRAGPGLCPWAGVGLMLCEQSQGGGGVCGSVGC